MTYSIHIDDKRKIIFSDTSFKPICKKPTMSVYNAEENVETKVATFSNQEAFERFVKLLEGTLNDR